MRILINCDQLPDHQAPTSGQVGIVTLGPPGLILQPLEGLEGVEVVHLDHTAPACSHKGGTMLPMDTSSS